jgi:arylsulfatase A-like enzyme
LAEVFKAHSYDTAYIGKWHLDGPYRSNYIPPERHKGFDYWKVLGCTHDYNNSYYYVDDDDTHHTWEGYDAIAQTRDAQQHIRNHNGENPFLLVLSWGPPHAPYETAPEKYRQMYNPSTIQLRPNVPDWIAQDAREWIAGYYAHCTALDDCLGNLRQTLKETGLEENTIFIFTSDHGDMLGSQGMDKKQKPWDESIRIPFLLHYPALFGKEGRQLGAPFDMPDVMHTLLGLCDLPIPNTVEGVDFSHYLQHGGDDPSGGAALLACYYPYSQWSVAKGGRDYRGVRTNRYTYVRTHQGPWLLYDNETDPYQLNNLVNQPDYANIQQQLETQLQQKLDHLGDEFSPGLDYVQQWGYPLDENGEIPYTW